MGYGLELYAVDESALLIARPRSAEDVHAWCRANATSLPNARHYPHPLDRLLPLDAALGAAGFAPEFRYVRLAMGSLPFPIARGDDPPYVGWIAPAAVRAAVAHAASTSWVPENAAALEELLDAARAAAKMGAGLSGCYV